MIVIYLGSLQTIDAECVYFAASRTSGEIQHDAGDFAFHSRFGPQHPGCIPSICGAQNVIIFFPLDLKTNKEFN